jgi:2-oxoglutarate ferredoxin oxidoreductase subunit beta
LHRPEFPLPIGVIRAVESDCYEESLQSQVDEAIAKQGPGDLASLLNSGDTWTVKG